MERIQPGDPTCVGGYELLGRLGQGGMGQVFLGRSPAGRPVAVKLIRHEYADRPEFRRRFAQEVEAARRVGGHYTAQVIDAAPDADPPWMVTAYVRGPSLRDAIRAVGPLPADAVCTLGACLAEGLAAIHACELVHRDVKPENIILTADGPRIIDFGIARLPDATTVTGQGWALGTYAYMSPEQAQGLPVGSAGDVFSLGSTLAFTLTGRNPFGAEFDLSGIPVSLQGLIAGCLATDAADRLTVGEILSRLTAAGTSRHWPPLVLADLIGSWVSDFGSVSGRMPCDGTVNPKRDVSTPRSPGHTGYGMPPPAPPGSGAGPSPAAEPLRPAIRRRTVLLAGLGTVATAAVTVPVVIGIKDALGESGHRHPAGVSTPPTDPNLLTGHTAAVNCVAFSRDGKILASAGADRTVRLWDLASRRSIATLSGHADAVNSVACSPDWKTMATGSDDRTVRLWDLATRQNTAMLVGHTEAVTSVAFAPDGGTLASGSVDWFTRLWSVASRQNTATLSKHRGAVNFVTFGPDGKVLMTAHADNSVGFWHMKQVSKASGILTIEDVTAVNSIAMTTGAIAIGADPGWVSLWDGQKSLRPPLHTSHPVNSVAFHRDDQTLAVGTSSGVVLLWNTKTHKLIGSPLTGHHDAVTSVAFSPGGTLLASASKDHTIRVWRI